MKRKSKLLIILLVLTVSVSAQSTYRQHQFFGAAISYYSYHALYKANHNKWKSRIGAVLVTSMAGVAKEYYDLTTRRGMFDKKDIRYTISGSVILVLTFKRRKYLRVIK
jgi:hypothetical protein